jgi:hypothetical protein
VADVSDNCQFVVNTDQADLDGDFVGDVCDLDTDGDGVENTTDNCLITANADQLDNDENGVGNICESVTNNEDVIDDSDEDEPLVPQINEVVRRSGGGSLMKTVANQNTPSNIPSSDRKKILVLLVLKSSYLQVLYEVLKILKSFLTLVMV